MKKALFAAAMLAVSTIANATPVYVGSYQVDQGPRWGTNPSVFSATEAAALLFGGVASDYDISTMGVNPFDINDMGWYTIWGVSGGTMFAEDYKLDLGAPGYNDPGGVNTAISAYTWDNAQGAQYTNYVFLADPSNNVPEPASLALIGLGLAGLGFARRKNRKQGTV